MSGGEKNPNSVIPAALRQKRLGSGDLREDSSETADLLDPGRLSCATHSLRDDETVKRAWVVFSGHADLPWLKILRPGFRHCYLILNDGKRWITYDPLSSYTDIAVHDLPVEFNLPLWMVQNGTIIVPAKIAIIEKQAPWMVFTCVEAVKRVLGIHNRFIITPWQLYRHLRKGVNADIFKTSNNQKGEYAWEV